MNGVVSIVSKHAPDTQGSSVSVGTGAEEHFFSSVRHGGRVGNGYYRIFGNLTTRDDAKLIDGSPAEDWQRAGHGGARFDFGSTTNQLTLQGDGFVTRSGLAGRDDLEASGANVLARWSRSMAARGTLQAQVYFDHSRRLVPLQFDEVRDTIDVDLQHRFTAGRRNQLSWGGGFRTSADDTTPTALLFFEPEDRRTTLVSGFVQDEWAVTSSVMVTGGVRLEHNDYTGLETQPTVRARWRPYPSHAVWGAVSRAVRLPTRLDTDVRITQAGRVVISGNIRSGGLEPKPVDLATIVDTAVDVVTPAASAKDITIDAMIARPAPMRGDADRLQQIFWNLLSNAVKFTPRAGRVTVRLSALPDTYRFEVTDSGEGIPKDFLPHIFEAFRQADGSMTCVHGGLGLGLAIARHLTELSGGQISAHSEGQGGGGAEWQRLDGCRVLLVDDDEDTRRVLSTLLEAQGAKTQTAASVAEARRVLTDSTPDVIITDIAMPGEDGYALLRYCRAHPLPQKRKVTVLALTAYAGEQARDRVMRAGFNGYLSKPLDPAAVSRTIAASLS